jgi:hypothetical protein
MTINTHIKILLFATLLLGFWSASYSQSNREVIALIKVSNSKLLDERTMIFDLHIERISDKWLKFVNGTFSFNFEDSISYRISPFNTELSQIKTELRQDVSVGNDIPTKGYRTDFQIYDNRLSITILGPEKFEDCESVEMDKPLLLGTFTISTSEQYLPDYLIKWMEPHSWYQACAFKLSDDILIDNSIPYFYADDNMSMDDSTKITYLFINDTLRKEFRLDYFRAMYIGQLKAQYYWRTIEEYDILGYTVYRGINLPGVDEVEYSELVGTWRPGDKHKPEFIVNYNYPNPKLYAYYDDYLEFRGGSYCYALYGSFIDPRTGQTYDRLLDTSCVPSPRAVISEASAYPEVFTDETTIKYTVDDDVYLTAFVSDILGKELKKLEVPEWGLLDKKIVKRGTYTFQFRAPDLASQGFYNIRFIAMPIDDPTVEESRADVKLQLVK